MALFNSKKNSQGGLTSADYAMLKDVSSRLKVIEKSIQPSFNGVKSDINALTKNEKKLVDVMHKVKKMQVELETQFAKRDDFSQVIDTVQKHVYDIDSLKQKKADNSVNGRIASLQYQLNREKIIARNDIQSVVAEELKKITAHISFIKSASKELANTQHTFASKSSLVDYKKDLSQEERNFEISLQQKQSEFVKEHTVQQSSYEKELTLKVDDVVDEIDENLDKLFTVTEKLDKHLTAVELKFDKSLAAIEAKLDKAIEKIVAEATHVMKQKFDATQSQFKEHERKLESLQHTVEKLHKLQPEARHLDQQDSKISRMESRLDVADAAMNEYSRLNQRINQQEKQVAQVRQKLWDEEKLRNFFSNAESHSKLRGEVAELKKVVNAVKKLNK